ncbi:MAG: ABC transporter ATP-binding protein [Candidatus Limnocylindria bacterium]
MIFAGGPGGRPPRPEVPREHGGFRNLPRLFSTAFGLVWAADRRRFSQTVVLQILSGAGVGIQLLITRNLIAAVLDPRVSVDPSPLVTQLVAMVLLEAGQQFIGLYQTQQQQVLSELVQRRAALRIVDVASQIEMREFDTPMFQDRMQRAQFAMQRLFQVVFNTVRMIGSVSAIVGVGIALYLLAPLLLVIVVAGAVPAWLANMAISRAVYRFMWEMTPDDRKRGYVMSLFTARDIAKEVRAFGLTGYLRGLYERLSDERVARLIRHLRDRTRISFMGSLGSAVMTAGAYGALAYFTVTGRLGLPEAGAAAAAVGQMRGQIGGLVGSLRELYESSLFLYDAESFLALLPALRRPQGLPRGPERFRRIELRHARFTYPMTFASGQVPGRSPTDGREVPVLAGRVLGPGGPAFDVAGLGGPPPELGSAPARLPQRPALRDISMHIDAGEIVALVGENGSGKTTLAKVLSGLYRPDSGQVLWDGIDVTTLDPDWLHDQVTVVFQDFARFMLTVKENIGLGRVERIEDVQAIVEAGMRSGADGFIREWASGYDTVLGPVFLGGKDISIGQWQRIALARAFFRDAPLVILDEPTAALDARAEHDLFQRMRELFRDRSVLLISHRFSSVRSADRIYVLHEGEIVEEGTHDDLMRVGGRYQELFSLQARAYFPEGYGTLTGT